MTVASTSAAPVRARRRLSRKKRNDYMWFVILVLPALGGLFIFYIVPFFQTIYNSLNTISDFGSMTFAGFANYKRLFTDSSVGAALINTLIYTVLSVPIGLFLSTILAVLLNAKIRGRSVYRTLFFLPSVTMPAAIAMVWKWLYNSDYGLINYLLKQIGVRGPHWLSDPKIALYSIIIVAIWSSVGYNMIILLAGLQGIPVSYYEAAEIDGASAGRQFLNINVPMMPPPK